MTGLSNTMPIADNLADKTGCCRRVVGTDSNVCSLVGGANRHKSRHCPPCFNMHSCFYMCFLQLKHRGAVVKWSLFILTCQSSPQVSSLDPQKYHVVVLIAALLVADDDAHIFSGRPDALILSLLLNQYFLSLLSPRMPGVL